MSKIHKWLIGVLVLGAVLWNGWLLGGLNHGLAGYFQMSISELEAVGQPHAGLFNLLENVSGGLLIIGGVAVLALITGPNSVCCWR